MKRAALILSLMLAAASQVPAFKEPKQTRQKKTTALSEEDREMLKDREVLENLELLLSLEKIQYLDLFTETVPKKESAPADNPAKKKPERKK